METNNLNDLQPQPDVMAADSENPQTSARRRRRRRRTTKGGTGGASAAPTNGAQQSSAEGFDADNDGDASDDAESGELSSVQASAGEQPMSRSKRKRNRRKKKQQEKRMADQQSAPPQPQAQQQPRQPRSNGGGGHQQRSREHNPGNSNGGARRNGRQRRGAQAFVGPMDHLYRGNDNLSDSTMGFNGNYRGSQRNNNANSNVNGNIASYAESVVAAPVKEDAPTRVFCFIEDLFFHAKIRDTARQIGLKVEFVKAEKEQIDHVFEVAAAHPVLVVVDLGNLNLKPIALVKKLKPKLSKGSSLIGFVSHIQGELKVEAQEAGCDVVMPKSAFSSNLPNILRRYVEEDTEEPNFNSEAALY